MIALHAGGSEFLSWHTHPDVIILCVGMLACYWYAVQVWRPRIPDAGRVRQSQVIFFSLGVLALYLAAGSPIHDIGEDHLLSAHMAQLLVFTLVAPPLLLAGIPTWLYTAVLGRRGVKPIARVLLHPLVAIFAFNMVMVVTHLPHVMDFQLRNESFHLLMHALIVSVSLMMWWPVITKVPGLPQMGYPYQMAYLFAQSLVPAVLGSFMTFSRTAIYDFYEETPRLWGLGPVDDQQLAAFIVKVVGSLILWTFIGVAFFKWYAHEEAESRGLPWREIEEELREIGVSPNQ